jgi:hypothetical protein
MSNYPNLENQYGQPIYMQDNNLQPNPYNQPYGYSQPIPPPPNQAYVLAIR